MARAEPPTPRRPAAPGPVRHTQRPGAGRPPPTPPPADSAASAAAARGICPRAGPGRADAKQSDEGTLGLTGPTVGEAGGGRVGMERGREERGGPPRPGPTPSSGRTGVTTPRRVGRAGEGCRAHAHRRLLPSPSLCFRKLRPNLQERPPRCVSTQALLPPSGPFEPPTYNLEYFVWAGWAGQQPETHRKGGRTGRDAAAG